MRVLLLTFVVALTYVGSANAAIIEFDLLGKAGAGLLPGNENVLVTGNPGTGGEVGAGITFDDATLALTINVAWGSVNGFANLTSTVSDMHIHGPTPSSGAASFTENAGVLIGLTGLPGYNTSVVSGGNSGSVILTAGQATDLLAGRFYLNVHTATNSGGEIRGNMVRAIPEPTTIWLLAAGMVSLLAHRKWGRCVCKTPL